MIATIHQPEYLPYIGFFDRLAKADVFVVLDNVQYQKNGFINRNRIKTADGWQWLTVPVKQREALKKINQVEIDDKTDWQNKHWKALVYNYKKAPYFTKYADFFENVYQKKWKSIADLDVYLIENIMVLLGIKKEIRKSSVLNIEDTGTEKLINICKTVGADAYLSGPGNEKYNVKDMDLEKFKKRNIKVIFHEFTHPIYSQQFPKTEFMPNLSIIDFLFNCGKKKL